MLIVFFLLVCLAIVAIVSMHSANLAEKKAHEREEQLRCARFVWPHATMSDDGVIHVDMALEDKFRAENPGSGAIRREMFAQQFRTGR